MSEFLPAVALSLCHSASTGEEPGWQFLFPQSDPPQPPKLFESAGRCLGGPLTLLLLLLCQ